MYKKRIRKMEFFERAHVAKKHITKKDIKSEESVKKQLKQMLHGYKRSDNKLIKEAGTGNDYEDLGSDFDNSSSVSGFSDLNITNSSTEGEKSHELPTDHTAELFKLVETSSNSLSSDEAFLECFKDDLNSIPEEDENVTTISDDVHVNSSYSESENVAFSDLEKLATSSELSSTDSEFDRNGHLASRILKKLGKREEIKSKNKKRKFEKIVSVSGKTNIPRKLSDYNLDIAADDTTSIVSTQSKDRQLLEKSDSADGLSHDSSTTSLPFVSVIANQMPDQSLNEILGEYRYSTVKKLPCDKHNVINSSLFSMNSVDSAEIQIEEDVDSLIPELGEDPAIEDLEIDAEVDISLQQTTEESNVVDNDKILSEESFTDIQGPTPYVDIDLVNSVKVFYHRNKCIIVLKHPSKIYIHGKVRIKVIGGAAEAFGYTLNGHYCDVFAPNYNFTQSIKTVESDNNNYGLFRKLTSSGLSVKDAEDLVTELNEYDAVIKMSALNSPKMDYVETNFRLIDLFSRQNKKVDSCFKQASETLICSLYLMPVYRCYEVNSSWEYVINSGRGNESRTIVCGGKGLGKSTFLRYFVNRLLANGPVLVIDVDPGQAEFTVAGHVSVTVVSKPLLGPNFTHLVSPDLMLNIGMMSPMENPYRYVNAVAELLSYCRSCARYKSMPWIVNTMGMTNNMGLKLITLTIMHVRPTFVLQIDNRNNKKGYGVDLHRDRVHKLLKDFYRDRLFKDVVNIDLYYKYLKNVRDDSDVKSMPLSPRDERYLNFLAYFGELINVQTGPGLLGIVPYEVKIEDLNIGMNVKIPNDAVTKVINGKIIALCQLTTLDKGKVFVLANQAIRCLGHGLVRCVDLEKGILYVVTPTPIGTLSLVNTLVYADWVPELIGEERHLPIGSVVPYRSASVNYKQKELMVAPRRRFNPLQLLKSKGIPKLKPSVIC